MAAPSGCGGAVFDNPPSMNMKTIPSLVWFCLVLAAASGPPLQAQQKRTWIPVDPQAPEGSPVVIEVLKASPQETELDIRIPGLWSEQQMIGERAFLRLSYPEITLRGVGFPARQGTAGWWDFPTKLRQPLRDPAAFVRADGSVRRLSFPESAVGSNPKTAEEMIRLGIDPEGARPGLPRLRPFLAMSRKNRAEDFEMRLVESTPVEIRLKLPVAPAGFEGGDAEAGFTAPDLLDEEFYSTFRGRYIGSEKEAGDVAGLGGNFSGMQLSLAPVTLLEPAWIEVLKGLRLQLKHLQGAEDFDCPIPWDSWLFSIPFTNGEAIRESLTVKGLAIEASRSARYVILCPKDWRSTLDAFALWKQAKGLNVDFVYVGAGGDIAADRNAIDQFLEDYFKKHYCNGVYVLICGDQNVIPAGRSTRITGNPDGSNADSDHVYEVLGSDRFPSMYVGRLSANSTTELNNQLEKILQYERTPRAGNWPTIVTLCANGQMDNGDFGVNSEWPTKYSLAVEQTATYGGYTNPPTFERLHAGAASSSVVRAVNQDVIDVLNAGRGQVLYRGHGNELEWVAGWDGSGTGSGIPFSASSHVDKLANPVQPIVYAINCLNNRIVYADCIGERWMSLANAGAVAHWGATVTSSTSENHERTKGIFRAIYEHGHTRLGPMLARAEAYSFAATGGGGTWDNNTFCYLLLGDPEMEIRRRSVPMEWTGGLVGEIIPLGELFKVRVTDVKGLLQPGAFVNLTLIDGRRFNGFANTEGEVEFPWDPRLIARMDLILDGFPFTAEYLQAPALVAVGFQPEGGFKVRLKNAPQGKFRIYGSPDLAQWTDLGLATPVGQDQEFIDLRAQGLKRFYRAVQE